MADLRGTPGAGSPGAGSPASPTDLERTVSRHYATGGILERIIGALQASGVDPANARSEDLKPVDEFHIGGVEATRALLAQIELRPDMDVLDIGSGLGGTARFVATETGCTVTGLDLTPEYVETATALSTMVGIGDRTRFVTGSALAMPFEDDSFDAALLLHVGMNISDKPRLMAEAARVLRPSSPFAVYEVMRTGPGDIVFPVPWADAPETSFLASPEAYREAAAAAGFEIVNERERTAIALDFFARVRARMAESGPPPLGIHLLMGETRAEKVANMVANISAGRIAPVELILRAPT